MSNDQLPASWVEKIFQKLSLVYGRDFLSRWEGQNLSDVQADWAHELAGYVNAPNAIKYALENLPEKPPTVLQFRAVCRQAPIHSPIQLPEPNLTPEQIAVNIIRLREVKAALLRRKNITPDSDRKEA